MIKCLHSKTVPDSEFCCSWCFWHESCCTFYNLKRASAGFISKDLLLFFFLVGGGGCSAATVLPAKSDIDVMFCLESNQGLRIYRSHIISIQSSSNGVYK